MIGKKSDFLHDIPQLSDLSNTPREIFYNGVWDANIFKNCVAVVGSRQMTEYGKRVVEKLIPHLVASGKTIVSGFMYGVDQYAHQKTVEMGGKTIAVLGWGIEEALSVRDKILAEEIIKNGSLIISEWEKQRASSWTFPARNRIVAAMASEVYVVEATIKSGSIITANLAFNLKRTLFAIPGPITSKASEGTNYLIASGRAKIWTGEDNLEIVEAGQTLKLI